MKIELTNDERTTLYNLVLERRWSEADAFIEQWGEELVADALRGAQFQASPLRAKGNIVKLQTLMPENLARKIDRWRISRSLSRSAAIRTLVEFGLEQPEALKVCPVHGIPDCSPLLNGCSWSPLAVV